MRHRLAVLGAVGVLLATAACGSEPPPDLLGGSSASADPAADVSAVRDLLAARAQAVRDGDRRAFLAAVPAGDGVAETAFRVQQRRLFDNLRRLPVAGLRFTATGGGQVTRTLRLAGFDDAPHTGPAGFAVRSVDGRLRVVPPAADQDAREPWDLTRIQVTSDAQRDVLLVHDGILGSRTDEVVAAVHDGIDAVSAAVPFSWSRTAVVYAFDKDAVLSSYAGVPDGNLRHLGALTFPVPAVVGGEAGGTEPAVVQVGQRIALLPGAMEVSGAELRRVVRHELTHAAVGDRDDDVPTWLAEGIAEHVASLGTPRRDLRIPTAAVTAAEQGTLTLPTSDGFNDDDQDLHYAVSWMACDWLADQQGEATLWRLLEAMSAAKVGRDGVGGSEQVLQQVTGLASYQLADGARERILDLFG